MGAELGNHGIKITVSNGGTKKKKRQATKFPSRDMNIIAILVSNFHDK